MTQHTEEEVPRPLGKEPKAKGNVLIVGNSGVGKSTLVNAVFGEDRAETSFGQEGTTKELHLYESTDLPFRVIDTVGFEPTFLKRRAAIHAIRQWSHDSAKEGKTDTRINVIWFCVEGTSSKLFTETIKNLSQAISMWPSVPIIAVITKSFSVPDREKNIELVTNAFSSQSRSKNLRKIIPVVAQTFILNESAYAAPEGITELIDATNELLPEGYQAAERDIAQFKLDRKRALAQGIVAAATTGAAVTGAVPIPFPDAAVLVPIEVGEINALAKLYGIHDDEDSREFLNSIVQVGTVSLAAKTALNTLKALPGINLGAAALNAILAGGIVAALGEGSIHVFEQVYLGNKSVQDLDWVKQFMESKLTIELIEKLKTAVSQSKNGMRPRAIADILLGIFTTSKNA